MEDRMAQQQVMDRGVRERELVLPSNEFAFVQDNTKGIISTAVGPYKTSLANTDRMVCFYLETKRFGEAQTKDEAIQLFKTAPENWYIILKNPAKDNAHPRSGVSNSAAELEIGKKINIPGPCSFALWPGQMCKIIEGHRLRSNQYLVVQIYDVQEAKKGWSQALLGQGATKLSTEEEEARRKALEAEGKSLPKSADEQEFIAGQILIIKGTEVSFYIPPTGVEVLPDENGSYIRDAVTLQRLEYCQLVSEGGQKVYPRGERVIFPEPNQQFVPQVDEAGNRTLKFKAVELSDISGLYIKVIAPYKDEETGAEHKEGEELFLTGKDKIYFPRPEHAIISYNGRQRIHAVAIPSGEGRYVMNRKTGDIKLVRGPTMLLPDPRKEVIVKRILSDQECTLLYPDNAEALAYNRSLREKQPNIPKEEDLFSMESEEICVSNEAPAAAPTRGYSTTIASNNYLVAAAAPTAGLIAGSTNSGTDLVDRARRLGRKSGSRLVADTFNRPNTFSAPRALVLNEKYQGAISFNIWSGYAVQIVRKDGTRRVVTGPTNVLLEYDEMLECMALSTGKPKTNNGSLRKTGFLLTRGNKVSDVVELTTKDLVNARLLLKYRVNFEGEDPAKWFQVSNYVQLLCDHARSRLKAAARKLNMSALRADITNIVRNTVLGQRGEDSRPGMQFEENGMRVFDVEVLELDITDPAVKQLLLQAQFSAISSEVAFHQKQNIAEISEQLEALNRKISESESETQKKRMELQREVEEVSFEAKKAQHLRENSLAESEQRAALELMKLKKSLADRALEIEDSARLQELEHVKMEQDQQIQLLQAKTSAQQKLAEAFSPHLVAVLQQLGDQSLAIQLAQNFSELGVAEGKGIAQVAEKFLDMMPAGVWERLKIADRG